MAGELRSLRVPGAVVQRAATVGRWLAPYVLAGVVTVITGGWRWFESRTSRTEVGREVATATLAAKAAKATAFHAESLATAHAAELRAIWSHVIAMRAELVVWRAYAKTDALTRSGYIADAQEFYAREFELQLQRNAIDPAAAARLALQAKWRPGL